MRKNLLTGAVALGAVATMSACQQPAAKSSTQPNIIVVLLDDLGSGDVGFNGCQDIPTPNIDRIADQGVRCTDAYITAPYSGPSRAGILTGRYQQRYGVDGNSDIRTMEDLEMMRGVPVSEVLISEVLKEQGYKTACIGKWHLGEHPSMWPQEQGFDYFYGFSGGGYSYWGDRNKNKPYWIQENGVEIMPTKQTYITDDFSNKAVDFIDKNAKAGDPFFIYLAYNAPHSGLNAPRRYLERTEHIANPERSIYGAMIMAVDDGLGWIWESLERNGIADDTILIFLSDNGGASHSYSMNYPRRARKGRMYDGGTKTPFAMCWGDNIKAGSLYDKTISSLNIFPTVVAAAGADLSQLTQLEGVDMMPYFNGCNSGVPNDRLYWRVWGGREYAMRSGDYKIVKNYYDDTVELYNLKSDPGEIYNIADKQPEIAAKLNSEYMEWDSEIMEPRWLDKHGPNLERDHAEWLKIREKASGNR
ncbi:MAG: sulfatase-like hydrolase/transferase [Rikenellaceae bacterium]